MYSIGSIFVTNLNKFNLNFEIITEIFSQYVGDDVVHDDPWQQEYSRL